MVKGVYYRTDWAEEAGLDLDPSKGWDYDDYFDAVAKLTNKDEKQMCIRDRSKKLCTYLAFRENSVRKFGLFA